MRPWGAVAILAVSALAAQPQQPASSLTGSVTESATGLPITGIRVHLRAVGKADTSIARSDTQGRFEFAGLSGGDYVISTDPNSGFVPSGRNVTVTAGKDIIGADLKVVREAVLAGRIIDFDKNPVEGALVSVRSETYRNGRRSPSSYHAAQSDDRGEFRIPNLRPGRYLVEVDPRPLGVMKAEKKLEGVAGRQAPTLADVKTYYPSSPSADGASLVTFGPGQEVRLEMMLLRVPAFCINSSLLGEASAARLAYTVVLSELYPRSQSRVASGTAESGEGLKVCGFGPGLYRFSAYAEDSNGTLNYASETVAVSDEDILAPALNVTSATPLRGRIIVRDAVAGDPQPTKLRVRIEPKDRIYIGNESPYASIDSAGVLLVPNVLQDDYWLSVDGLPDGYYVREATVEGRDAYAQPFRPTGELRIVLGADGPILSGIAQDEDGKPVANATVVLAAEPLPLAAAPNQILSARSGDDGSFVIKGMPPGRYRVVAFRTLLDSLAEDPGFARSLPEGVDVDLSPRERKGLTIGSREPPAGN